MPPRKSTSSMPPTDNEDPGSPTTAAGAQITEQQAKAQSVGVSVEDLLLPRAVTQRLAKSVLPPDTAIQKDALLAIQKAATVFVSYLSSHANEATLKRTLAPSDVLNALSELEFDSLRPQLERELDAHTEALAEKKKAQKDRKAANTSETQAETKDGGEVGVVPATSEGRDVTAAATPMSSVIKGNKRIKRDGAANEKHSPDETEVDEDETEEEEAEPEEEEEEEEDEVEEDEDDETQEAEDLDRVEDLDEKMQGDYDDSGSEDDDNGPAAQLRGFG
ncbi:hypothetical protein ZTR_01571 [Talaromyces verruculosus]|nr:hypothetical protein ZTR_01571 [Talaromyces verruculosus]